MAQYMLIIFYFKISPRDLSLIYKISYMFLMPAQIPLPRLIIHLINPLLIDV